MAKKGYGMIYGDEIETMHQTLSQDQIFHVLYNVSNLIARETGHGCGEDVELDQAEKCMYLTIAKRIKSNIEKGSQRPYGAPKGNKNAEAPDKERRVAIVKALHEQGKGPTEIEKITGYNRSTITKDIKKLEEEKAVQSEADMNAYFEARANEIL